jgi:NAD-dependent SIR2 family protein deacetylase
MAATKGPIESVPCPHCGKPNDFRDLKAEQTLDTGEVASCDHCDRLMSITAIQEVVMISVQPRDGRAHPQAVPPQPASTVGTAALRRYLKR